MIAKLDEIAGKQGVGRSHIIRMALTAFIKRGMP